MVPFFDLKRQYNNIQKEIEYAVHTVFERGMYTLGPDVSLFEREFADYIDSYHAIGVASGTDAITMALRAFGLMPSDEVILPANAYPTVFGVAMAGVKIRLVDCLPDGNIDTAKLERVITARTRVVVPVHMYGKPSNITEVQRIIRRRKKKIYLLEDAAQAHGAEILDGSKWRKAGTFGDIGIFSFYPTKNLGAYGDGGLLVTDSSGMWKKLQASRMYGETSRYHSESISGVSRLDELQAAILLVKLKYLDQWNKRRAKIAAYYETELTGVGDLRTMNTDANTKQVIRSCHHLFVIRSKHRDALKKHLAEKEIGTNIHYPVPVHLTPSFTYLGYKPRAFPEAEAQSQEVLSLPLFPELTDTEAETVASAVKSFYK
jgi:dTDP-4-amino-4,6-dideoxygalactose transaminase